MCDTLIFPNIKRIGQKKFLEQKYSWKFNKGLAAKDAQPARDRDELRIQDGGWYTCFYFALWSKMFLGVVDLSRTFDLFF